MSDDDIDNMDFDLPQDLTPAPAIPSAAAPPMSFPGFGDMDMDPLSLKVPPNPFATSGLSAEKEQEIKPWICIYPVYFDVSKSLSKGRRIPKSMAIENPAAVYIMEAVTLLGLEGALENNKRNPQDPLTFGRVRVKLKNDSGALLNSKIRTKVQLLVEIAKELPSAIANMSDPKGEILAMADLSRSVLQEWPKPAVAAQPQPGLNESVPAPVPTSNTNSSSKKKKKKNK